VTTNALLLITGLGLGALYFLIAAGLSLIWGLMRVLNFAHGAFFTVAAYAGWALSRNLATGSPALQWTIAVLIAVVAGGIFAALTEIVLIRPLYARHVGQVLVTVGLALAAISLVQGGFGSDPQRLLLPAWMNGTVNVLGANVPNTRLLVIAVAALVFALLIFFLRRTRFGLIVRAGVENRAMVQALGIDVRRAFTLVFAIGGVAAALAGALSDVYFGSVTPERGTSLLIFAFIVVVIGGLGSIGGSAIASVVVALAQQYANYYASSGLGDITVVLLLGLVLLARPRGLSGALA
jgi:branched-chain amino acid transport system permease protein